MLFWTLMFISMVRNSAHANFLVNYIIWFATFYAGLPILTRKSSLTKISGMHEGSEGTLQHILAILCYWVRRPHASSGWSHVYLPTGFGIGCNIWRKEATAYGISCWLLRPAACCSFVFSFKLLLLFARAYLMASKHSYLWCFIEYCYS